MKTCPRCNATIEEGCRFCPNCGASQILIAPQRTAPEGPAPETSISGEPPSPPITPAPVLPVPGLLRPTLISGLVMGGLSALPVLNVCCCLWMVGGGVLACYLYLQEAPPGFVATSSEGAKVGLAAGFFGFITGFGLFAFIQGVILAGRGHLAARFREHLQNIIARQGEVPPETRQFLDWLTTPSGAAFFAVFTVTVFFVAFLVLGAVGGMLGANFFAKRARTTAA